tara:strand:+ start:1716 stop:1940 length:225 start_codon:yes stop_codon:yes gene_type:complete
MAYGSYGGSRESEPKSKPKNGLTDKQKTALKRHMEQHKDLKDMSPSQLKSHRMKMMSRMRKGMSISQAHKDIGK